MTVVWDFVRVMGVVWGMGIAGLVVLWVWSWWDDRRREKAWDAEIDEMEREFDMDDRCECGRIKDCTNRCRVCDR